MKIKGCYSCGGCVAVCPKMAITLESCAEIDPKRCISCKICEKACPLGLIDIDKLIEK
ncbi:MAG: 4Fe-4S dicluster domain-containing protein [Candidatus Altiarchaeota archaeon]